MNKKRSTEEKNVAVVSNDFWTKTIFGRTNVK